MPKKKKKKKKKKNINPQPFTQIMAPKTSFHADKRSYDSYSKEGLKKHRPATKKPVHSALAAAIFVAM
jgi:hypothetical protein